MAERALYGNHKEPEFPFVSIRKHLHWLPEYLATNVPRDNGDQPILNTLLVFTRARTSTFLAPNSWDIVVPFAKRLNATTDISGASHHKLELFRVDRGLFFVTTRQSPRFRWKLPMTHYDVGCNLDYFAPGHLDPSRKRDSVCFLEKSMRITVTSEVVFTESLRDPAVLEAFRTFTYSRERLFNSSMASLGLDYEFKAIFDGPGNLESVARVVANPSPPLVDWWEDNFVFLTGYSGGAFDPKYSICCPNTKYTVHWPLIQRVFYFKLGYQMAHYPREKVAGFDEYWEAHKVIMQRIKALCEQDEIDHLQNLLIAVDECFQAIADFALVHFGPHLFQRNVPQRSHSTPKRKPRTLRSQISRFCIRFFKRLYIRLFEGFKLRKRLQRETIDYPREFGDKMSSY
jgi:hypothetical protein